MGKIIDVDAAKLAGLQVALLQKLRSGVVSGRQLEWFLNLTEEEMNECIYFTVCDDKPYKLLTTGSIGRAVTEFRVKIPEEYNHGGWLAKFRKRYSKDPETVLMNLAITDENCSGVTNQLQPGGEYLIRYFSVRKKIGVTSELILKFLKSQSAIFTGAQGISLLHYILGGAHFPSERRIYSFDEREALPNDPNGWPKIPYMQYARGFGYRFDLDNFENERNGKGRLTYNDVIVAFFKV